MKDEQEQHEAFERLCGSPSQAERLFRLYKDTHDNRTALDKLMGKGCDRDKSFRRKALRNGYTVLQADTLLALQ